jgi:hypothetical protein
MVEVVSHSDGHDYGRVILRRADSAENGLGLPRRTSSQSATRTDSESPCQNGRTKRGLPRAGGRQADCNRASESTVAGLLDQTRANLELKADRGTRGRERDTKEMRERDSRPYARFPSTVASYCRLCFPRGRARARARGTAFVCPVDTITVLCGISPFISTIRKSELSEQSALAPRPGLDRL